MKAAGQSLTTVIDMQVWCQGLLAFLDLYFSLRRQITTFGQPAYKVVLSNVANTFPYIPLNELADHLIDKRLPFCVDSTVMVAPGFSADTFLTFDNDPTPYLIVTLLALTTLRAMGFGIKELRTEDESLQSYIYDFLKLLQR